DERHATGSRRDPPRLTAGLRERERPRRIAQRPLEVAGPDCDRRPKSEEAASIVSVVERLVGGGERKFRGVVAAAPEVRAGARRARRHQPRAVAERPRSGHDGPKSRLGFVRPRKIDGGVSVQARDVYETRLVADLMKVLVRHSQDRLRLAHTTAV